MSKNIFIPKKVLITLFSLSLFIAFMESCKKDSVDMVIKEKTVNMDTKQEIPTVKGRNETGTANFKLNSDSTLTFKISVANLDNTDPLTMAHIHAGSPVESGSPVITLVDNTTTKFQGSSATGTIKLSGSQFGVLNGGDFYVNVHSTKYPIGLIRGQMDKNITFAQNIDLTPISNPLRPETGMAILRLTSDSTLYYKVTVNDLTSGDALTVAQINVGTAGVNGPSVISLYTSATEFDTPKTMKLNASQVNFLLNSQIYVVVGSTQLTDELVRGQIR